MMGRPKAAYPLPSRSFVPPSYANQGRNQYGLPPPRNAVLRHMPSSSSSNNGTINPIYVDSKASMVPNSSTSRRSIPSPGLAHPSRLQNNTSNVNISGRYIPSEIPNSAYGHQRRYMMD